ncbi:decay [Drosophila busckii]|uniref:Decay n=1 Tax=Drosophila busckii TaxID=30019 RepID=A0A0M4EPP4_DROBS|nr:caspase-7 [Drosophila busckii]ALC46122.1 decay [Drosophila busckii]
MDETDFSLFGKKNKHKKDKADATQTARTPTSEADLKRIIISRPTSDDTYENCQRAGIAIILNHKDVKGQKQRVGTERDRDDVQRSLQAYGFDVRPYNDLSFAEINDLLKEVAREDHSQNDCFALVVMSHGSEGKVYAKDMSYPVERLWNPFLGDSCKSLVNKPKLFFIQACRGENLEKAVEFTTFSVMTRDLGPAPAEKPQHITYAIPSTADMLVFYSTFDKYFSFRNVDDGSWFIQSLCRVLDEAAANEASQAQGMDMLRLCTAVNRKVAYEYQSNTKNEALNQMKEMPNFLCTLTKTFALRVKPKN